MRVFKFIVKLLLVITATVIASILGWLLTEDLYYWYFDYPWHAVALVVAIDLLALVLFAKIILTIIQFIKEEAHEEIS